jgi:hypothetical protein
VPPKNIFSPDPAAKAPLARKEIHFSELTAQLSGRKTSLIPGEQGGGRPR